MPRKTVNKNRPAIRFSGHEVIAVERSLSHYIVMVGKKPSGLISVNAESRREMLVQINNSGLLKYVGNRKLVQPGTCRFYFPPRMIKHMVRCSMLSRDSGWDMSEVLVKAINKLKRALPS